MFGNSILRSSSLWWNLGKTGSKLQECHDCSIGQPKPHRRGTQHDDVSCRALTAVSDDPEDLTALTPNHFLLGRENASAPFMPSSERYHNLRKSFKTAQAYADMICKRWIREYLPQWNQRSKWSKEHVRNLKEGELVWLVDDSVKRCEYKLGRIIEICTGNDGVVRSARVKMSHGELNRPVVKLAPVFNDGVSEIENRTGNVGATSNELKKPSDSRK